MPDLSSPLLLRGLAAAAALVVIVGGGLLLANAGSSSGPASTAAGSGTTAPRPNSATAPRATGSTAALRLPYKHNGRSVYANAVTTDASYTKASLPAAVLRQVASSPRPGISSSEPSILGTTPSTTKRLGGFVVGRLESCLSAVAQGHLVLLAALARYEGVPAAIIVLTPVSGAFDVIVVGQACAAGGGDVITRLIVPQK